ncbi:hypothetical protein JWG42_12825 [Desulfoprunum benzoelyticum]|uniref:Polysaccharide chain length determinant protein (PEP-CTERM system associated) n=1 Tax=Desulfoprunum benzoelyticum TaxID=1506996 RepID=A0A840UQ27_9BACT|nr:XrtA system polysaccharide chain length determinant [Desulfoprunum benzoelyticum]MBB5346946.1 polysaccharide chain length determinant protein (PEP-CTERM system associated) [Desulfoprunum benzoelyticum]MBM9531036.1 hypothetical protein [Desulfoprunum benzoelyticum]
MEQQQHQQIRKYLDLFVRWKSFIVAAILISLPVGLAVYLTTPKVYQSTSLLSYEQRSINPSQSRLSPDMASAIRDVVSTLTKMVTSRTNLENVITTLDLYPEMRQRLPMEDVIDMMRKNIEIVPMNQGDIFEIRYSGGKPDKVVKVTNALAAKFIEENLKFRAERATETSAYASDELEMAKTVMDRKDAIMRDYKLKHYNELPEHRQTNVSRLIALQEQYQAKQESIQDLEKTAALVQDQITNLRRMITSQTDLLAADDTNWAAGGGMQDSLIELREVLKNLQLKYTENHPEVKRTKKRIARLEQELANGGGQQAGIGDGPSALSPDSTDPILLQLKTQLKNIQLSIRNIEAEKESLRKSISQYEEWVAAAPVREAEWSALTREYGELKRHYDMLVSSDLQAKSMLNLEKQQKGSQFKIVDSARVPEKPIKPDFVKILAVTLFCSLGLGFGVPFVWDFLDPSFRDQNDIETYLGVPVLCTIPLIETEREKTWGRRKFQIGLLAAVAACAAIAVLFAYCWRRGLIVV